MGSPMGYPVTSQLSLPIRSHNPRDLLWHCPRVVSAEQPMEQFMTLPVSYAVGSAQIMAEPMALPLRHRDCTDHGRAHGTAGGTITRPTRCRMELPTGRIGTVEQPMAVHRTFSMPWDNQLGPPIAVPTGCISCHESIYGTAHDTYKYTYHSRYADLTLFSVCGPLAPLTSLPRGRLAEACSGPACNGRRRGSARSAL